MSGSGIMDLFSQIQKAKENIEKIRQELAHKRVTATSGGGMVEVIANGKQRILDIKIEQELFEVQDKEMIEDLVVAAVNLALEKAEELAKQEMQKAAGSILGNLPEGLKIPGFNL